MHTVLIPPLLGSARFYQPLLPTVWAHGSVGIADTRRDATMSGMAVRLLASAPPRFAIVGTSMGGYLALEVVRQAPERIQALGLISTSARPDAPDVVRAREQQSDAVRDGDFDALVEAVFPGLVAPGHEDATEIRALWRAMASDVGAEAFLLQQEAVIHRADSRELLGTITVPTAVVHGRDDRFIAPENAEESAAGIPGARLTWIDHAGHFAVHEQPSAVAAAVDDLLRSAHPA